MFPTKLNYIQPYIISLEKTCFIQGRFILDATVVSWEGMKWDKNQRFTALFIKLDFERAYEQVDWSNILAMLRALFWSICLSGWWDV